MSNIIEQVREYKRSEEFKTLLFWGGPFSQWYPSVFYLDSVEYNCAEQAMMAQKAKMFNDSDAYEQIMATGNPREQKALGRKVKGFDPEEWSAVSRDFVLGNSIAKFSQNSLLRIALTETVDYCLVEASPYDKIWGIGLGEDNPDAFNPEKWKGKNWLGEALNQTRAKFLSGQM